MLQDNGELLFKNNPHKFVHAGRDGQYLKIVQAC